MTGLVHAVGGPLSSVHVKEETPVAWKLTDAEVELVSAGGEVSITVAGVNVTG